MAISGRKVVLILEPQTTERAQNPELRTQNPARTDENWWEILGRYLGQHWRMRILEEGGTMGWSDCTYDGRKASHPSGIGSELVVAKSSLRNRSMSRKLVVVLGGNGYLGQRIVNCALKKGANVLCVSRSGVAPPHYAVPANLPDDVQVTWHKGISLKVRFVRITFAIMTFQRFM